MIRVIRVNGNGNGRDPCPLAKTVRLVDGHEAQGAVGRRHAGSSTLRVRSTYLFARLKEARLTETYTRDTWFTRSDIGPLVGDEREDFTQTGQGLFFFDGGRVAGGSHTVG